MSSVNIFVVLAPRALLLMAALCATSCTRPTSVLLIVEGDVEPGVDVDVLSIEIRSGSSPLWAGVAGLDRDDELPQTLRILPGGRAAGTIEVEASARLAGETVVSALRQVTFREGHETEERLCLYLRCADSLDAACLRGECDGPAGGDGDADGDADGDPDADGSCTGDGECDDGDPCNGAERCVEGECEEGDPPECDDHDECTTDGCDLSGCTHEPRDDDGDGSSPEECPGGDDCDDGDPLVGPERPEVCGNLVDDDCDGLVDFEDDCPTGESCGEAIPLVVPGVYHGSNVGAPDVESGSCGGASGEVVYRLDLEAPSSVHVDTTGSALDTVLWARSPSCDVGDELLCDQDEMSPPTSRLDLLEVLPGTYYFFVDGAATGSRDTYALTARWAPVGCGNGLLESGEGCDDGNAASEDACSASCERQGRHALRFDGVDDSVRLIRDSSLSLAGPMTVELWFRMDEPIGEDRVLLLRKGLAHANYYIWIWYGGLIRVGGYLDDTTQNLQSTTIVADGGWHHVAMTYDRTNLRLFVDGVVEGELVTAGGGLDHHDTDVFVGRAPDAWTARTLPGAIDDLRISSVDRYGGVDFTPSRRHPLDDDVVALFRFDEGSGDLSADEGPSQLLGLVTGCEWEPE